MRYTRIPDQTIRRLPVYLRGLFFFEQQGRQRISSSELAEFIGMHHWQIRKDFSYFGEFGTRGVGYETKKLIEHVKKILGLTDTRKAALIGVGNLGSAVLAYGGFKKYGFEIVAAFDNDPKRIGKKIGQITIEDSASIGSLKKRGIALAIIAIPENAAQKVADAVVEAGVVGILNFSPFHLVVPKKVKVITVDIAMDLARLPYYMPNNK